MKSDNVSKTPRRKDGDGIASADRVEAEDV